MTELQTFMVPDRIDATPAHRRLAARMLDAWRRDGIFQVAMDAGQNTAAQQMFDASRHFFRQQPAFKQRCVSDLSYGGYVASGEDETAGEAGHSEVFTVCQDVPAEDARVLNRWPCHGPIPWPDGAYQDSASHFMAVLGGLGERLLRLVALGLDLERIDALTSLTADGWHHMRVLRFPSNASGLQRGIGAHTDYGLLVIAAQDEVGGLYVRPPVMGEHRTKNWLPGESSVGMYENDPPWMFVKPVPGVLTVFPGDIMQFVTDGFLLSTPHKVKLNTRERFALAYFHEPNFNACVRPLFGKAAPDDYIHYGTHFTNMFMRCHHERMTTRRIVDEDRLAVLTRLRSEAAYGSLLEQA